MLRQYHDHGGLGEIPIKTLHEVTDPVLAAELRRGHEAFGKNSDWLEAHLDEILPQIRGKHIAVAGQELFVAETAAEVYEWARTKHPEDPGPLFQRMPAERRVFIG